MNKIKSERKKKNKNFDKIKQLESELVKIKYANKPNKLKSEFKELNKIPVVNKNLHENKNEILLDYTNEFEMVGSLKVVDQIHQTHIRFRNLDHYESYFNSIDERYDAENGIFNGHIYKILTPQFISVKRSQYGNGCDFRHEIIEYRENCFIPTKGFCFVECNNFITGEDYKQQYLDFIRNEKKAIKCYD